MEIRTSLLRKKNGEVSVISTGVKIQVLLILLWFVAYIHD